nr:MAG TPA: G-protein coupled receptor ligand 15 [Caudoviricetes sp.]DAO61856.1 MAG TPA: G-protein coupled receptor ligand 15 [Caudoviricetes sp.]
MCFGAFSLGSFKPLRYCCVTKQGCGKHTKKGEHTV